MDVVTSPLIEAFARSYDPPCWIIEDLLHDGSVEVREALRVAIDEVLPDEIASLDSDALAQSAMLFATGDHEWKTRLYIVSRDVFKNLQERRLALAKLHTIAPPYDHPALRDLVVDEEGLVPLAAFTIDGDALYRNGYAFFVLPPVPSSNANYWLLGELLRAGITESVKVRLDPLLYAPANELRGRFYRAAIYGRDSDWGRVHGLREVDHGRWAPRSLSRGHLFTDYAWLPHDQEVDFLCEEMPLETEIGVRGSRYLHAIYDKERHEIRHLDGAIRLLQLSEFRTRTERHVRNAGKAGIRIKIFRTDRSFPVESLSAITQGFFYWNYDVARYFGAPIHPDL